jgi:hypothetical protein
MDPRIVFIQGEKAPPLQKDIIFFHNLSFSGRFGHPQFFTWRSDDRAGLQQYNPILARNIVFVDWDVGYRH